MEKVILKLFQSKLLQNTIIKSGSKSRNSKETQVKMHLCTDFTHEVNPGSGMSR